MPISNPVFEAFCVEVMALIALELGDEVFLFVIGEANRTLVFVLELGGVIVNAAQRG